MFADIFVESFEAFPEELLIRRKTHMALTASCIGHADMKVVKIWLPVCGHYLLKEFNVKMGCYLADYLLVSYGGEDGSIMIPQNIW